MNIHVAYTVVYILVGGIFERRRGKEIDGERRRGGASHTKAALNYTQSTSLSLNRVYSHCHFLSTRQ